MTAVEDLRRDPLHCPIHACHLCGDLRARIVRRDGRLGRARLFVDGAAMKIRYLSDLHYEMGNLCEPKPEPDYDVCVIAGDWNTGEYAIEGFVGAREELRRHT